MTKAVNPMKTELKKIVKENGQLTEETKRMKTEIDFWKSRAAESGTCIFTEEGLCGLSSNALVLFACGKDKKPQEYPRDDGDWGRCERTIMTIPFKSWLDRLFDLPEHKDWKKFESKIIIAVTRRMLELNKAS